MILNLAPKSHACRGRQRAPHTKNLRMRISPRDPKGVSVDTVNFRTSQDSLESLELLLVNRLLRPVPEVVFSLYIAFATLVMLNLVTGVFVEGRSKRMLHTFGLWYSHIIGPLKSEL